MKEDELEKHFYLINQILTKYRGIDLTAYKKNFILRRLQVATRKTGINDINTLIIALKENDALADKIAGYLTINVSSFFRNPDVFKFLEKKVISLYSSKKRINVLSCGCASGEEAYSIAAILVKNFDTSTVQVNVTGIDISAESIKIAKRGLYAKEKIHEIPYDFRKYFHLTSQGLEPKQVLKDFVSFLCVNIIDFTPDENYDIILLRNILIFMRRSFQRAVLEKVLHLTEPGASVILGKVESIPSDLNAFFKPLSLSNRVYIIQKSQGG